LRAVVPAVAALQKVIDAVPTIHVDERSRHNAAEPYLIQAQAPALAAHLVGLRLKDFPGFMIGKDKPEGLGFRPTKASKNAGLKKHTVSWGGQHGYLTTALVG
jgi:hypothetical protein